MRRPTPGEVLWLLRDWYEDHWRLVLLGALIVMWTHILSWAVR